MLRQRDSYDLEDPQRDMRIGKGYQAKIPKKLLCNTFPFHVKFESELAKGETNW